MFADLVEVEAMLKKNLSCAFAAVDVAASGGFLSPQQFQNFLGVLADFARKQNEEASEAGLPPVWR